MKAEVGCRKWIRSHDCVQVLRIVGNRHLDEAWGAREGHPSIVYKVSWWWCEDDTIHSKDQVGCWWYRLGCGFQSTRKYFRAWWIVRNILLMLCIVHNAIFIVHNKIYAFGSTTDYCEQRHMCCAQWLWVHFYVKITLCTTQKPLCTTRKKELLVVNYMYWKKLR